MNADAVVQIIRDALMMAFWLSAPLLLVGFAASVVVSLVQIVTSIQDATFNTVPRSGGRSGRRCPGHALDAAKGHGVRDFHSGKPEPLCSMKPLSR